MSLQLEAPIAYRTEWETRFQSLTSSCQATAYEYTTPTSYALGSTTKATSSQTASQSTTGTTTEPNPTVSCASSYVVQNGDTCDTIAAAQNVSNYNLILANNLDLDCTEIPEAGESLCIPQVCPIHRVTYGDNCRALASAYNATTVQIVAWNPNFDRQCINMMRWEKRYICVG